jgi:DNA polymerase III psi subunit
VVEFLSSFFNPEGGHELRKEAAVKVLAPLLQDLIPAFNLKPRNVMQASHVSHLHSNANFFKWSFSQEKPTIEPIVAPVQGDALARLFNTILSLRLHEEASHLLNQIQREAEVQDAKYFPVMFLPFLQFMIPVWSAQGIEYDDHICQSLYQSILRSCLLRYVGKRPQPPTHWSRAPVSCRCADCSWLNSFLVDKEKSVDYFSIAEKRRKHLQYQLQGGDCTYITQQNGIPYTLVVTKTRRAYEKLLTEWKRRCKDYVNETTGKFRRTVLRQLLGSEFEELTSVVLLDSSLPVTRQLIPSAGNSRASAAPKPRVSPKRIAGTKRKAIEIIDLT